MKKRCDYITCICICCGATFSWFDVFRMSFLFLFLTLQNIKKIENQNKLACNVQKEEFCYRIFNWTGTFVYNFYYENSRSLFPWFKLNAWIKCSSEIEKHWEILHVTRVYFYNLPEVKNVQMILLEDLIFEYNIYIKNFMPLIFLLPIYTVCIHLEYRYARIANWKTLTVSIIHSVAM